MGFTTSIFIFVLFPICLAGYYLCHFVQNKFHALKKARLKDIFLCLFSLFFYSFFNLYNLCFIILLIAVTFGFGKLIEKAKGKDALITAISIFVLTLFFFKYFEFSLNSIAGFFSTEFQIESIIAPLGISFIIFSAISYVMDIYRKDAKSGGLLDTALYISFFPKVISGPIVLWKNFRSQLSLVKPDVDLFAKGINRICIGFAKKVILADTFGLFVNEALENLNIGIDMASAWIIVLFFFFEIYFDFAGYSDISIGISNILGFEFDNNFNFPYLSTSITDFWKRWHISLGVWFKEYLYIPLGGNRKSKSRTIFNLLAVFLVTGIWHGAGLPYLLWGIMHGICRAFEKLVSGFKVYQRIPRLFKWAVTIFIVMMGWTAFCFNSWTELVDFWKVLFGVKSFEQTGITVLYFCNVKAISVTATALLGSTVFGLPPIKKLVLKMRTYPLFYTVSELIVILIFIIALIFMINSTYSPFLYFQY